MKLLFVVAAVETSVVVCFGDELLPCSVFTSVAPLSLLSPSPPPLLCWIPSHLIIQFIFSIPSWNRNPPPTLHQPELWSDNFNDFICKWVRLPVGLLMPRNNKYSFSTDNTQPDALNIKRHSLHSSPVSSSDVWLRILSWDRMCSTCSITGSSNRFWAEREFCRNNWLSSLISTNK